MKSKEPIEIITKGGVDYFKLCVPLPELLESLPDYDTRASVMKSAISDPLKWFCPNGKQEEFINEVAQSMLESKVPVVLFTAANGVGKTMITLQIIANIVYGAQNGWFLHEPFLNWKFPKVIWYVTTRNAVEKVIPKYYRHIFKESDGAYLAHAKPYVCHINFSNGWELWFFTHDQATSEMESDTVGMIIADEPAPQPIWNALKSRRRGGCLTIMPMTPLSVEPYVIEEIERNASVNRKGYKMITASVYDACKVRGVRGHLDADVIDDMVKDYDDDEREARVYGRFMYFKERIFARLNEDIHRVDPIDYPINTSCYRMIQAVDPHDGRPASCVYIVVQPIEHSDTYKQMIKDEVAKQQYRYIIIGETPLQKDKPFWDMRSKVDLGDEVQQWIDYEYDLLINYGVYATIRVLDKRFGWQTRIGSNIALTFMEEGSKRGKSFVFQPSYSANGEHGEIAFGHNQINTLLGNLEDGRPGLVIYRECYHTWKGLMSYVKQRPKSNQNNKAVGETKIIEKFKDFPDAVRYGVCAPVDFYIESYRSTDTRSEQTANSNDIVSDLASQLM